MRLYLAIDRPNLPGIFEILGVALFPLGQKGPPRYSSLNETHKGVVKGGTVPVHPIRAVKAADENYLRNSAQIAPWVEPTKKVSIAR